MGKMQKVFFPEKFDFGSNVRYFKKKTLKISSDYENILFRRTSKIIPPQSENI